MQARCLHSSTNVNYPKEFTRKGGREERRKEGRIKVTSQYFAQFKGELVGIGNIAQLCTIQEKPQWHSFSILTTCFLPRHFLRWGPFCTTHKATEGNIINCQLHYEFQQTLAPLSGMLKRRTVNGLGSTLRSGKFPFISSPCWTVWFEWNYLVPASFSSIHVK